uniref:Uncharacterized protein n=1 Tax=Rhizophora mucronata TaxID=61149 RepID=A0A2P2QIX2_RHIMU
MRAAIYSLVSIIIRTMSRISIILNILLVTETWCSSRLCFSALSCKKAIVIHFSN